MSIMIDPMPLYPQMFHPIATNRSTDLHSHAPRSTRTRHPAKYWFTDFSNAQRYKVDSPRSAGPVLGVDPKLQAPEFKESNEPRDPFPTDVYYLGNMIHHDIVEVWQPKIIPGC